MTTLVEHKEIGARYVLLGAGFGAYQSAYPGPFLGALSPTVESGQRSVLAVCNAAGEVLWFEADDLRVVSVDGVSPAAALGADAD